MSTDPQGVVLGLDIDRRRPVLLSGKARTTHMEIIGASGLGKTRFMEHLIREDIIQGRGACVIDPTGNLYKRIVKWLARNPDLERPVVLFDPGDDDYVMGYNPIRRSKKDTEFRVDEVINAIVRVWGADNLQATPLLKRCLKLIFLPLAERGLTLVEARHFINPDAKDLHEYLTGPLAGTTAGHLWARYADENKGRQFFEDFSSTISRLLDFSAPRLERIFGQTDTALDIRQVMDQGGVLLVNLSREGLSEDAARLIGTLLVYDFFLTATERPEGSAPFYLYIDECYDFVTEDLGKILDRCRQHGLHAILAHQHLSQLKRAGETVYMAMRTDTKVKVVFGGLVPEEARIVAEQVYMGELDPDEIKHELHRTFEHHRLQWLKVRSQMHGRTSASGGGHQDDPAGGIGRDNSQWSDANVDGETVTDAPMLIPEEDKELSSVQFRSSEEQLTRAMATMINQPAQQAVVKILTAPTYTIQAPTIPDHETPPDMVREYITGRYRAVPFCVPTSEADRIIDERTIALFQAADRVKFARLPSQGLHSTLDHEPPPTRQPRPGATATLRPASREAKASTRQKRQEKPS